MKNLCSLFILALICVCAKVSAQVPPAYQGDFNRMMANNSMRMAQQMSMQRMMNQRWDYGFNYVSNYKYDYTVTMKDNSVMVVTSKMYVDTTTHKSYLLYINKSLKRSDPNREKKIYADQTTKISRTGIMNDQPYEVPGMATDSCWLFLVQNGKINVYSHLSEVAYLNTLYLRAFQVGNGPVQKIDSAALLSVIKDNTKAMKAFKDKDYYTAILKYNK